MALVTLNDASISERVAHEIREAIQSGEYSPGERLIERALAARLGVSHIPVREALTKLADEGLVERMPRRGARVAALTERDLLEISSLRTLLEEFVCHRVQDAWSDEIEMRLRATVALMITASELGDAERMFELDRQFHEALWEVADHSILLSIASQLRGRINGFLRVANGLLSPEAMISHALSHRKLIDALASMDRDLVSETMAEHIDEATRRIEKTQYFASE